MDTRDTRDTKGQIVVCRSNQCRKAFLGVDTDYGREGYKTHYTGVEKAGLEDFAWAGWKLMWEEFIRGSNGKMLICCLATLRER